MPAFADNNDTSSEKKTEDVTVEENNEVSANSDTPPTSTDGKGQASQEPSSFEVIIPEDDPVQDLEKEAVQGEEAIEEVVVIYQADNAYLTVAGQVLVGTEFRASPKNDLTFEAHATDGFEITGVKAYAEKRGGLDIPFIGTRDGIFKIATESFASYSTVFIEVITQPVPEEESDENKEAKSAKAQALTLSSEITVAGQSEDGLSDESSLCVVEFMVDGEVVETKELDEGVLIKPIDDPENPDVTGAPFHAWYEQDAETPFDFMRPISQDDKKIILNAVFSTDHTVRFMDYDGSVLSVISAKNDTKISDYTAPTPNLPTGLQFSGWSAEEGGAIFEGALTENLTLYPTTSEVAVAVFITNGPAILAQTGPSSGFQPTRPNDADMVRGGYTFSHWTLDSSSEDIADEYTFDTTLSGQVTYIYAVWKSEKVGYILNLWNEKANFDGDPGEEESNYELVYTATISKDDVLAGVAGEKLNASSTEGIINESFIKNAEYFTRGYGAGVYDLLDYSDFSFTDAHKKELLGTGDTVINLYAKRIEYTYNFELQKSIGLGSKNTVTKIVLKDGTVFSGEDQAEYSITVKYGQDITELWPYAAEPVSSTAYHFLNWNGYYGLGGNTVNKGYVQKGFGVNNNYNNARGRTVGTVAQTPPQYGNANYFAQRSYWTELSETEYAEAEAQGLIKGAVDSRDKEYMNNSIDWDRIVKHEAKGETKFYRLAYLGGREVQGSWGPQGWPGRSIAGFLTITTGLTKEYQVAKTKAEMDAMPVGEKFSYITYYMPRLAYEVNLVVGKGDSAGATIAGAAEEGYDTTSNGYSTNYLFEDNFVLPSAAPTKEHYQFEGWYLDENYMMPFYDKEGSPAYTTMPGQVVTLYGKLTGNSIAVNYYGGLGTSDKIGETASYGNGELLRASDVGGTIFENVSIGDKVEGYGTFRGWFYYPNNDPTGALVSASAGMLITGNPGTTYNLYADFESEKYTVTYVGLDGKELGEFTIQSGSRNTMAGHGNFEENINALAGDRLGYAFAGWNTESDGTGQKFTTATKITKDTVVYAQWRAIPYDITYVLNDEAASPAANHADNPTVYIVEDTSIELKDPTREGYTFNGWYGDNDLSVATTGVEEFGVGDRTFYAKWGINDYDYVVLHAEKENTGHILAREGGSASPGQTIEAQGFIKDDITGYTYDSNGGDIVVGTNVDENTVYLYYAKTEDPLVPVVSNPDPGSDPRSGPEPAPDPGIASTPISEGDEPRTLEQEIFRNSDSLIKIADSRVPLGPLNRTDAWSLLSLLMSLLAIITALVMFVWRMVRGGFRKKENGNDEQENRVESAQDVQRSISDESGSAYEGTQGRVKRNPVIWAIAVILGIVPLIVFLVLDDLTLNMAWINANTPIVLIFFALFLIACFVYLLIKKHEEFTISYVLEGGENNRDNPMAYTAKDQIVLKDPNRAGYVFDGWYADEALTERVQNPAVTEGSTGNKRFYARWAGAF